jgi:asparagine synthase (glutamine-hydrolysing)
MCGIAGIYVYRDAAPPVDSDELLRIREAMVRRGPDGAGFWISEDKRIGLAHRRLAIIDLSDAGLQPMATVDGRLRITFNGEIYNYRELKKELEAKGYIFQSGSDTEVLLHLYADRGQEMVHALRGMYAFAIWDDSRKAVFLARDPFGIKPLYYADNGATIRIASQVKALLAGGAIDTKEDPAGHASFLLLGSVADPFTLYRNIRALPAGSSLWIDRNGAASIKQFFRIADVLAAAEGDPRVLSDEERSARIADALRDSVRSHLVSDVPIGVFLSAGIDSSSLLGLACEAGAANLRTMTLGFREYAGTENDETALAESIAHYFGAQHESRWVGRADFEAGEAALLAAMDQPTIDGVNTYFVAKAAAEAGMKVALSGLGGDELFGGYPSFHDIPRMKNWLGWGQSIPLLGRTFRRLGARVVPGNLSPKLAGLLEFGGTYAGAYLLRRGLYMPWELAGLMGAERARAGLEALQPIVRLKRSIAGLAGNRTIVSTLELEWYMRCQLLRDADWAGMAHSLEIRVPFVDTVLLRALAPSMASPRPPIKRDLVNVVGRGLPRGIVGRSKTGFTIPTREWAQHRRPGLMRERGLRGWARFVLNTQCPRQRRVLISTLVPGHGGVATMTRKAVDFLKHRGYDVALAYYMPYRLAPSLSVPLWEMLCKRPASREAWSLDGVRSFEIGVRLPELEGVRCFPSKLWKRIASQFDYHLAISGSALAALPIVFQDRRCLAWIATPYLEDKIDRARRFPWYRRIADTLIDTPMCRRLEKAALRNSAVLALSEYTATALRRLAPEASIVTMPMPIDSKLFYPKAARTKSRNRIGFVGRFADPRKNMTLLFEAVAICRARGIDVTCDLVGDEATEYLEALARTHGITTAVNFLGFRPRENLVNFYNDLDVMVIASHQEGLGIVGLEAMACGCPVVATRCGGTEDYVKDGVNGFLVGFSGDEMADAIVRILGDSPLRLALREGALRTVRLGYSDAGVEQVFWREFDLAFQQGAV